MTEIDKKTIDRVCVGLAELILRRRSGKSRLVKRLCWLLKTLVGAPFDAASVLQLAEGHDGTPEQLVETLQELAVVNVDPKLPDDLPRSVCNVCGDTIVCVPTGLGEGDETWIHELPANHRPKPKGETE